MDGYSGVQEFDNISAAIVQHLAKIDGLKKIIKNHEQRISVLRSIDTTIFKGVKEYEDYLQNKGDVAGINNKIAIKLNHENVEKLRKHNRMQVIFKDIRGKWKYITDSAPLEWNDRKWKPKDLEELIVSIETIDDALDAQREINEHIDE